MKVRGLFLTSCFLLFAPVQSPVSFGDQKSATSFDSVEDVVSPSYANCFFFCAGTVRTTDSAYARRVQRGECSLLNLSPRNPKFNWAEHSSASKKWAKTPRSPDGRNKNAYLGLGHSTTTDQTTRALSKQNTRIEFFITPYDSEIEREVQLG